MNSITRGSAFIRAKGSRSDLRQWRRISRSVFTIGPLIISTSDGIVALQPRRRVSKRELGVSYFLGFDAISASYGMEYIVRRYWTQIKKFFDSARAM